MREHIEHLLAALGALGFALFVSYFNTGAVIHLPSHPTHAGLTPLPSEEQSYTVPAFELSTSTLESILKAPVASTSVATTTPKPVVIPKVETPKVTPPKPAPLPATTTSSAPAATDSFAGATVNIICLSHTKALHSISGSGVIIDSRGIVLTVAHVAQVLLLEKYLGSDKVSCTVRMGSPAKTAYFAHPIYVSEAWLDANPSTLISSQPTGTGEHDYALLAITSSTEGKALPRSFPAVPLAKAYPHIGDMVRIGTYGSQELSSTQVRNALYPIFATSTVKNRFTFKNNTIDVLALSGNTTAQEGSSGGGAVNEVGELMGMVTTSEISGPFSSREMRVITPQYMVRNFTDDTGKDFATYFGDTSIDILISTYSPTARRLGEELAHAIGLP